MRYLFIVILLSVHHCFSQETTTCWECIVATKNPDSKTASDICNRVDKKALTKEEKELLNFILGKFELNGKQFDRAIQHFQESLSTEDSLLQALNHGLLGDCYVEKGSFEKALTHYEAASVAASNTDFEVYFLHKQGICYSALNKVEEHKRISSLLKVKYNGIYTPFYFLYAENSAAYDSISRTSVKQPLPGPYGVGTYRGKHIDESVFSALYEKNLSEYRLTHQGKAPSSKELNTIYKNTWEHLLLQLKIEKHQTAFALQVTDDEVIAYLAGENGYELRSDIEMYFSDENGVFQKELLLHQITSSGQEEWNITKHYFAEQINYEKLMSILKLGFYVNNPEAELFARSVNEQLLLEAVVVTFEKGQLSETVDEKELRDYYEQHKFSSEYTYDAERQLRVISIPIHPNVQDSSLRMQEMLVLGSELEKTESAAAFVAFHSDNSETTPSNAITHLPKSHPKATYFTYPDELHSYFKKAKKGMVSAPYWEDNQLCIAKVEDFSTSMVTARHILIQSSPYDSPEKRETQLRLTKEILSQINNVNFEAFVKQYSYDPGTRETGGVIEDFFPEEMVPSFARYCATEKIGKIGYIESDFGFHIVEVLKRKKVKYPKLHIIKKQLKPTVSRIENEKQRYNLLAEQMNQDFQSLSFEEKLNRLEQIDLNVNHIVQTVTFKDVCPQLNYSPLGSLENELLRFAYSHSSFTAGNALNDEQQIIIPILTGIYSGEPNMEQVYEEVKRNYLISLKSDSIYQQIKHYTDLEKIASELQLDVNTVVCSKVNGWIDGLGYSFETIFQIFENKNPADEIVLLKDNYGLFAYKIIDSREEKNNVSEDSDFIIELWNNFLLLREGQSHNGTTIYNYPLYKLGLRK